MPQILVSGDKNLKALLFRRSEELSVFQSAPTAFKGSFYLVRAEMRP